VGVRPNDSFVNYRFESLRWLSGLWLNEGSFFQRIYFRSDKFLLEDGA
jgi:hypothetical protein